jgi:sucrose phosphorylase
VLHAFGTADAGGLAAHLAASPDRQFTTLDTHDGIPVRPDLDGILRPGEMAALAEGIQRRGGNVNRILSTNAPGEVDVHQLNCAYYAALDCDDERYLAARAIQLFARGVPQIYYVGLLAGANDTEAVDASGDGRAVNRHDYSADEIASALSRPVVRRLLELVRLRNSDPAFDGEIEEVTGRDASLRIRWRNGDATCTLEADLASGSFAIS